MNSDSAAEQHVLGLAESLHQFQQEEHLCDVTLEAKDGQMKAHSIVLAAASSMLRTVLSGSRKSVERVILLPWLKLYELDIVVHFIYTGKVVVPAQYALPATLPKIISALTELGLKLPVVQNSDGDKDNLSEEHKSIVVLVQPENASLQMSSNCLVKAMSGESSTVDSGYMVSNDDDDDNDSSSQDQAADVEPDNILDRVLVSYNDFFSKHSSDTDDNDLALASDAVSVKGNRNRYSRNNATVTVGDSTKVPCLCHTCGKEFSNTAYLTRHARTHTGEQPYACADCGRLFRHVANLARHQKVHTGEKPHVCHLCGAGFIQNVMLIDHRSRHHLESVDLTNAPFVCRTCGERFLTTHRLRTHTASSHRRVERSVVRKATRNGENSEANGNYYECGKCAEKFESKVSLSLHMRRHVVKKPHECTVCSCAFDEQAELTDHMQRHMSHWPRVVKRTEDDDGEFSVDYLQPENLQRLADNSSSYECTVCGKQVKQLAHLKSHMLMHTGERPHKCQYCTKAYRSKYDLRLHSVRVHDIELPARRGQDGGLECSSFDYSDV